VSGGLDSSSILCLAETLRGTGGAPAPPLIGMSYLSPDGSPSDEKEFLVEIERQYGLAIERVPITSFGLMEGAREAVWHVEAPFLDNQWSTSRTFFRRAGMLGTRVMLTGHWADQVLFPQAYLVDLFRQLRWRDIGTHLHAFEHWMPDVMPGFFRKRFWLDLVRHHVPKGIIPYLRWLRASRPPAWYADAFCRRAFRHLLHRPTPDAGPRTVHAKSLYEEARSPYHVHCMEWNNKVASMYEMDMAFPFLDRDLLSFLMNIPGDVQTWKGVPKALLREGMRGILPEAIANRKWKADFTHLVNEGMERDFPQMLGCLQTGSAAVDMGYVNRDALQDHLSRLQGQIRGASTAELSWTLTDLLGLELWLQVYFDQRSAWNQSGIEEQTLERVYTGGTA
jgi:asparagine synthase (glutamine-hydrolysing)